MCYRSDDEEQMEFIRKYNEKRAEMKSKHRKLRRVVKVVIVVIVVSVLMRVGMMLLM